MITFSIRVASVIGNFMDVPRHAHSIVFLLKSVLITPNVVILKIKKVIKGLKGAVKAHTGQHKMLSSVLKGNGKNKKRS
jgi:hypothetical protein